VSDTTPEEDECEALDEMAGGKNDRPPWW
jgi:hypothetical protein